MSDDYLWDGSGTPDPDVERLERLLGRLRSTPPLPTARLTPRPTYESRPVRWRTARFLGPALAAAAAIALMIASTWQPGSDAAWMTVASIHGQPRVGWTTVAGEGRISVGETLMTDRTSRARIEVGTIGQVTVDTDTRVRLVETRDERHQLALEHGTLHAFIVAPPGQFIVDTPSATATDLGCVYDLTVDEDGTGMLTVVAGWVAFEERGRESFVPAGASARTDRDTGPGTPRYNDAAPQFIDALDEVDRGNDVPRKGDPLRIVLDRARPRDAMTLWHLVSRVRPADRAAVVDALAALVPLPPAAGREAVLRLDRDALDAWWEALGLRDAGWWRTWKRPLPDPAR
jgi:FecR-like protein